MCCKMEVDLRKTRILASNPVIVITTRNPDGSNNAGAFGSYMRVDNNIIIAIHPESHTFRNIRLRGEFVINVPGLKDMESVMLTGRSWAEGTDEIAACGLKAEPSLHMASPTIMDYPACVECRLVETRSQGSHMLVTGEMTHARCDEAYLDPAGCFDLVKAGTLHIVRYPQPVYTVADRYIQGIQTMD